MGFTKYVCPTFSEDVDFGTVLERSRTKFHGSYPADVRELVDSVLVYLNEQSYQLALVDGALKGTPADKERFQSFGKPDLWEIQFHGAFTVLPYNDRIIPCSPFIQLVRHVRKYIGESRYNEWGSINTGDVQDDMTLYYENNRCMGSVNEDMEIKPKIGSIGRYPIEPNGAALAQVLNTLTEIDRMVYGRGLRCPPPLRFGVQGLFIVGKRENDDVDQIAEFLNMPELVFV